MLLATFSVFVLFILSISANILVLAVIRNKDRGYLFIDKIPI